MYASQCCSRIMKFGERDIMGCEPANFAFILKHADRTLCCVDVLFFSHGLPSGTKILDENGRSTITTLGIYIARLGHLHLGNPSR